MLSGLLSQVFEKLGDQNKTASEDREAAPSINGSSREKQEAPYMKTGAALPEDTRWEWFVTGTEPTTLHSTLPPPPLELLEGIGFTP